jgi:cardiolipin synthase
MQKHVPNFLSISRILLAFFFAERTLERDFLSAAVIFLCAAISDFLDGFLARKYNATSLFGAILDPLADKILMTISYGMLYHLNIIPFPVCLVVIGRDVLILLTVLLCAIKKISLRFSPFMLSKINTVLQLLYVVFLLSCNCFQINVPFTAELTCRWVVVIFTIFSGAEYAMKYYWIKDALCKNKR